MCRHHCSSNGSLTYYYVLVDPVQGAIPRGAGEFNSGFEDLPRSIYDHIDSKWHDDHSDDLTISTVSLDVEQGEDPPPHRILLDSRQF